MTPLAIIRFACRLAGDERIAYDLHADISAIVESATGLVCQRITPGKIGVIGYPFGPTPFAYESNELQIEFPGQ